MTTEGHNIRTDGENIRIWKETKARLDRIKALRQVATGQKVTTHGLIDELVNRELARLGGASGK